MENSTSTPNGTTGPEEKTIDEETIIIVLISACLVAVVIFLLILWKCCRKKGDGLLSSETKTDFLIKRCDQVSTRKHEDRILRKLKRKCSIVHRPWDQDLDDGQQPVIVFCVISSRIGTDIENAMRGVQDNSYVILVVLHCILSGLLRGDLSDDEELLDPTLRKRMSGIAHYAFSDREGLYKCRQNHYGSEKLVSLVKSLSHWTPNQK